jgi:hypothetical protein
MFIPLLYFAPLLSLEVKTKVPAGSECNAPCGFFYITKKNKFLLKTYFPYTQSIIYGNISLWVKKRVLQKSQRGIYGNCKKLAKMEN